MRQLKNLVRTNQKFRKSVNLYLDLGNEEKVGSYIPTRSASAVLERYLDVVLGKRPERATILIGPYGKGKSHLLLVLLALLRGDSGEKEKLYQKTTKVNREAAEKMKQFSEAGKKYLPVLINPVPGNTLNQTFTAALRETLQREGLSELAPDSSYSEAVKTLSGWKQFYPDTYERFAKRAAREKSSVEEIRRALLGQKKAALEFFCREYVELTSGNRFAPMLNQNAMRLYQETAHILAEQYGYTGIFIVFDEFGKYIEGHEAETFAGDMKALQDMCELAEDRAQNVCITLVAHKSVHEYGKGIPEAAKNLFRGVEGRLTEIEFVVSAQNDYELIADAILKCEPEFSRYYGELTKTEAYAAMIRESWRQPCFQKLFTEAEFQEIIAKGCFPLVPVFAYALLNISEKIAQNERTVFTFLADEGQGSLGWLLKRGQETLIGIDKIYDYFRMLFRETADQPKLHNEWLKAEYALGRTEDFTEKAVIKAIAVIRMIHREEELPAKDSVLRLSLALEEGAYQKAVKGLKEKEIIVYRSSIGIYAFRNNAGIDVERAIQKRETELGTRNPICRTLYKVLDMTYELPRQYNQRYAMTRYFRYEYMECEEFFRLKNASYLFEENFSDGKLLVLIQKAPAERSALQKHMELLGDKRLLLLVSEQAFMAEALVRRYEAVDSLRQDEKFLDGNEILVQELLLYREDIAFEINAAVESAYLPENRKVWVLRVGREPEKLESAAAFGSILSKICEEYYSFSPRVNHELLNIQRVEGQYLRARNNVVKSLLEGADGSVCQKGTSPEAMIYRAAFIHTKGDAGCKRILAEIEAFFGTCAGKKETFKTLYGRLCGKDYGVRKGIIPLFLAKKFADTEAAAVIYLGGRELEVSCELLNKVNECPERYELYLVPETAEKERYLQSLEEVFGVKKQVCPSKQGRLNKLAEAMQNWYRSLPQYTMVTNSFQPEFMSGISVLRNSLKRAEVNPRELLLEVFIQTFGNGAYRPAAEGLSVCKRCLDFKLDERKRETAEAVKKVFGIRADASLKAGLLAWHGRYRRSLEHYILGAAAEQLMRYLDGLQTNNEGEIAAGLSKVILDVYIEDWNDGTPERFLQELCRIKKQLEGLGEKERETERKSRIILKDREGNEIAKYYEADRSNSTSLYLKNMISETLEEFGETLEKNQKVAVLVEMLEELLQ